MNISVPDEIVIEFPQVLTITQPYTYMLVWWLSIFVISLILKVANKGPNVKNGIIAALSILIMYVACALIYRFKPLGLEDYLVLPLPFLDFQEDNLKLIVFELNDNGWLNIPELCSKITSLLLLAFLVNQIYSFKPGNLKTPGWLVFRFFSTLFSIGVYYAVHKVLQKCLNLIPEGSIWELGIKYVPIAVLGSLLITFLLGTLRNFMRNFFKLVNPTFEGLNGFYYTNKFGVQLNRAIWSTLVLTLFAWGLQATCAEHLVEASVPLTALSPVASIALVSLFVLWIIVGFLL